MAVKPVVAPLKIVKQNKLVWTVKNESDFRVIFRSKNISRYGVQNENSQGQRSPEGEKGHGELEDDEQISSSSSSYDNNFHEDIDKNVDINFLEKLKNLYQEISVKDIVTPNLTFNFDPNAADINKIDEDILLINASDSPRYISGSPNLIQKRQEVSHHKFAKQVDEKRSKVKVEPAHLVEKVRRHRPKGFKPSKRLNKLLKKQGQIYAGWMNQLTLTPGVFETYSIPKVNSCSIVKEFNPLLLTPEKEIAWPKPSSPIRMPLSPSRSSNDFQFLQPFSRYQPRNSYCLPPPLKSNLDIGGTRFASPVSTIDSTGIPRKIPKYSGPESMAALIEKMRAYVASKEEESLHSSESTSGYVTPEEVDPDDLDILVISVEDDEGLPLPTFSDIAPRFCNVR